MKSIINKILKNTSKTKHRCIAVNPTMMEPLRNVVANKSYRFYDIERSPGYDNIGNYFISQALLDILDYDEYRVLSSGAPQNEIDWVNENCDIYIIRGSTLLEAGLVSKLLPYSFISRIKVPMTIIGFGNTNPVGVKFVNFTDEDKKVLRYIHDNSVSTMARGELTVELLNKIGIKNTKPLGCPTFYWSLKGQNKIKRPSWDNPIYTWREYLYAPGREDNLRKWQFKLVNELMKKNEHSKVVLQDMSERHWAQYYFAHQHLRPEYMHTDYSERPPKIIRKKIDVQKLRVDIHKRYKNFTNPKVINWMLDRAYYSFSVEEYADEAMKSSFLFGCRLHGNMIGMSRGIPAYFYGYDERLQELIDLFKLPHSHPKLEGEVSLPDISNLDYTEYEKTYQKKAKEFTKFLDENSLKHRMEI